MPNKEYIFLYVREQRSRIGVIAENEEDAYTKAQAILNGFSSEKESWDESDDPGELELEETVD